MSQTPEEAYQVAKAVREARIKQEMDAAQRQFAFPDRAKKRMQEIVDFLPTITPAGLAIEPMVSKAGNLGPRGITSVFFKLASGEEVLCQGSIACRDDEVVVLTGFPPDRDQRPEQELGQLPFDTLSDQAVSDFMAKVITHFIR